MVEDYSSTRNYTFYYRANDNARPSFGVPTVALLSRVRRSFNGRKTNLWMLYDFLTIRKIAAELTCGVLRSLEHFSTGHRTTRSSGVL